jgi:hypothetical protein
LIGTEGGSALVRFSKRGPFPLSVAPEEFTTNGVYEAVSGPSEVKAETEDSATDVEIVVRRVAPPRASAASLAPGKHK